LQQMRNVYNECRALDPEGFLEETTRERRKSTFMFNAVTSGVC
jgi:hypothetical protein